MTDSIFDQRGSYVAGDVYNGISVNDNTGSSIQIGPRNKQTGTGEHTDAVECVHYLYAVNKLTIACAVCEREYTTGG